MKSNDLLVGKNKAEEMQSNDWLVGTVSLNIAPNQWIPIESRITDSVTVVRKPSTCYKIRLENAKTAPWNTSCHTNGTANTAPRNTSKEIVESSLGSTRKYQMYVYRWVNGTCISRTTQQLTENLPGCCAACKE